MNLRLKNDAGGSIRSYEHDRHVGDVWPVVVAEHRIGRGAGHGLVEDWSGAVHRHGVAAVGIRDGRRLHLRL